MITGRIDPSAVNSSRLSIHEDGIEFVVAWVKGDAERLAQAVSDLTTVRQVEQWEFEVNGAQRLLLHSEPFRRLAESGVTFVPITVGATRSRRSGDAA